MSRSSIAGLVRESVLVFGLLLGGCLVDPNPKFGAGGATETDTTQTETTQTSESETAATEETGEGGTETSSGSETGGELMVIAIPVSDDAYVELNSPDNNYGGLEECWVSTMPKRDTLLKANLSEIKGMGYEIVEAQLVFEASAASQGPFSIRALQNMWNEGTVTWNMKPPLTGAPESQFFPIEGVNKVDLDVFVQGMNEAGNWDGLAILTDSMGELVLASSESMTAAGPTLELVVQ